jgi:molybdenum cofactor cytidylyltransferase
MGEHKLLLPWGQTTVVGAALAAACGAPVSQIIVVTGRDAARVEAACRSVPATGAGVCFIENPRWAEGMLTSVQAGLAALPPGLDGFFVALGDMPLVEPRVYAGLMQAWAPDRICVPVWDGRRGNPVLLPAALAAEALSAPPADVGLRGMLLHHPHRVLELPVDCPGVRIDLDTPEEYSRHAPAPDA